MSMLQVSQLRFAILLVALLAVISGRVSAQEQESRDVFLSLETDSNSTTIGTSFDLRIVYGNKSLEATTVSVALSAWENCYEFIRTDLPGGSYTHRDGYFQVERVLQPGEVTTTTVTLKPIQYCNGLNSWINVVDGIDPDGTDNSSTLYLQHLAEKESGLGITGTTYGVAAGYDPIPTYQWYINQDVIYSGSIQSAGPDAATSVSLEFLLPAGLTDAVLDLQTSGAVEGFSRIGDQATVDFMAPGAEILYTLTGTLSSASPQILTINSELPLETSYYHEMSRSYLMGVINGEPALADLSVSATIDNPEVTFAEDAQIHVTFTNNGPLPVENVQLITSYLFMTAEITDFQASAGTYTHGVSGSIIDYYHQLWLPILQPGQTETISFKYRSYVMEPRYIGIGIYSDTPGEVIDPVPGNNAASVLLTTVGDPPNFDLKSDIKASPSSAQRGGLLAYTMSVTNLGPDPATTVTLHNSWAKYTMPDYSDSGFPIGPMKIENGEVVFHSIQNAGPWQLEVGEFGLTARLPSLAADESATITLIYKVAPNAVGDEFGNLALSISAQSRFWNFEQDRENNTATAVTPIVEANGAGADLLVTRTAYPPVATTNQPLTFTAKATNLGPNPTNSAYMGNFVPEGMTIQSVETDKGNVAVVGDYVDVSDVALGVGDAVTMRINVVPTQPGVAISESDAAAEVYDPDLTNNTASLSTAVNDPIICSDMVNLGAELDKVRTKAKFKKKTGETFFSINAKVLISNTGNECAGETAVKLYLSDDAVMDNSDILLETQSLKKESCPGKKPKSVKFKLKKLQGDHLNPAGRFLIAVVDGNGADIECDETDNTAVAPGI